jgi:8-oxo-dGTP diphosphatase
MSDGQHRVESLPEAVVAVITKERKVLLIQRGADVPDAGYWAPLNGKTEAGEDQEGALVREVREEVALSVRPVRKVWENISASGSHKLHWWLAEWVSGDFKLDPREVADARWLGVDEVLRLERTFESDREFFKRGFPTSLTRDQIRTLPTWGGTIINVAGMRAFGGPAPLGKAPDVLSGPAWG